MATHYGQYSKCCRECSDHAPPIRPCRKWRHCRACRGDICGDGAFFGAHQGWSTGQLAPKWTYATIFRFNFTTLSFISENRPRHQGAQNILFSVFLANSMIMAVVRNVLSFSRLPPECSPFEWSDSEKARIRWLMRRTDSKPDEWRFPSFRGRLEFCWMSCAIKDSELRSRSDSVLCLCSGSRNLSLCQNFIFEPKNCEFCVVWLFDDPPWFSVV